jgi:hypothetical protein
MYYVRFLVSMYVYVLQVLTMRQYRVTCAILQHFMGQCMKVTTQAAYHIENFVQDQKGGVSMLPFTGLNVRQRFLPAHHSVFPIFFMVCILLCVIQ